MYFFFLIKINIEGFFSELKNKRLNFEVFFLDLKILNLFRISFFIYYLVKVFGFV